MARTTFLVELDDDLFAELKAGADALDISVETYAAVRLEQQSRQTSQARRGGAAWQPPQVLVLLTGLAAQAAGRNGGYRHADVARWVSHAVLEQAHREPQPSPRPDQGHPGAADDEPPTPQ